jgi:hypothetical protein
MGKRWLFHFAANHQGQRYQRINSHQGIRFSREGHYSLTVHWR